MFEKGSADQPTLKRGAELKQADPKMGPNAELDSKSQRKRQTMWAKPLHIHGGYAGTRLGPPDHISARLRLKFT
jgi:hypothetical protein